MGELVNLLEWAREHGCSPKESAVTGQEDTEIVTGDVTPIRRLQPGDVLDVIIKLRKLMSQVETCAFTLYASFEELGGANLDKEAERTRHTLELAAARMASLLLSVEKTPAYAELRRETLARRKEKAARMAGDK